MPEMPREPRWELLPDTTMDLLGRAFAVIAESDDASEHAELILEMAVALETRYPEYVATIRTRFSAPRAVLRWTESTGEALVVLHETHEGIAHGRVARPEAERLAKTLGVRMEVR